MGVLYYLIPDVKPADEEEFARLPSFELGKGLWSEFSLLERSADVMAADILKVILAHPDAGEDWQAIAKRTALGIEAFMRAHDWKVRLVNDYSIDHRFGNIVGSIYDPPG